MTPKPSRYATTRRAQGFGLLEAIVALVLISGVGISVLSWVQHNLDAARRLRDIDQEIAARRLVLDWSNSINPFSVSKGDEKLGNVRLNWSAERETPVAAQAEQGLHDLSRYRLRIKAFRPGDGETPWFELERLVIGYKAVRKPLTLFGSP